VSTNISVGNFVTQHLAVPLLPCFLFIDPIIQLKFSLNSYVLIGNIREVWDNIIQKPGIIKLKNVQDPKTLQAILFALLTD